MPPRWGSGWRLSFAAAVGRANHSASKLHFQPRTSSFGKCSCKICLGQRKVSPCSSMTIASLRKDSGSQGEEPTPKGLPEHAGLQMQGLGAP